MPKGNRTSIMSNVQWDFLLLFLLLLITGYLEKGVAPYERLADLQDPSLQFPILPEIISGRLLLLLSATFPLAAFALVEFSSLRQKPTLFLTYLLGLLEAIIPTVLITNVLKIIVGRPRPLFAAVCQAYVEGSNTLCIGDEHAVAEARKSFPSGHSSLSFATAIYTALFLGLRLRPANASTGTAHTWHLLITLLPPCLAALVTVSRTIDYHHHFADVVAGSMLGSFVAVAAFYGRRSSLFKLLQTETDSLLTDFRDGISDDDVV